MNFHKILSIIIILITIQANAQEKKPPFSISGDVGIWYEGYSLSNTPSGSVPDFYMARRPSNMFRYSFNPTITAGKWSIPFNFNFSPGQYNFVTPSSGSGSSGGVKQSFWQILTNPANNFGIRPTLGGTELLLGTQNLQYSDLSTGDVGVFGYGVNLSPGKFRIKLFNGVSQRGVNYVAPGPPPANGVIGAYQRNQWMAQLGLEKEDKYFAGFNFVRSSDSRNSVTSPPLPPIEPEQNMVISFLAKVNTSNGWKYHIELGQSFFTRDLNTPLSTIVVPDFKPFIKAHTSSNKDNAVMLGIAKKGSDWEIGAKFNYYGAGYYTAGYPFMQNDKAEYLVNTRFNAFKSKMNVVASLGQRFGNLSLTSGPSITKQIIANVNVFTQFNDHFSLNIGFNNYGFNASSLSGYKSVSNEFSVNPSYNWTTPKMNHLLSGTFSFSKYDETVFLPPLTTTHNNTKTALLLYVPTFIGKKISPDFSVMWFNNKAAPIELTLLSATAGMNWKPKDKINLKAQFQYSLSTIKPYTANKNLLATGGFDWEIYKKLTWTFTATANVYHYGTELPGSSLNPPYMGFPSYFETTVRTGLQYRF